MHVGARDGDTDSGGGSYEVARYKARGSYCVLSVVLLWVGVFTCRLMPCAILSMDTCLF